MGDSSLIGRAIYGVTRFRSRSSLFTYVLSIKRDAEIEFVRAEVDSFMSFVNNGCDEQVHFGVFRNSYYMKYGNKSYVIGVYMGSSSSSVKEFDRLFFDTGFQVVDVEERFSRPVFRLLEAQRAFSLPLSDNPKFYNEYYGLLENMVLAFQRKFNREF